MESAGRNPAGQVYLLGKLREHHLVRRRAARVVNAVFEEMGLALRRGEYVEFPFGYLIAEKRVSEPLAVHRRRADAAVVHRARSGTRPGSGVWRAKRRARGLRAGAASRTSSPSSISRTGRCSAR